MSTSLISHLHKYIHLVSASRKLKLLKKYDGVKSAQNDDKKFRAHQTEFEVELGLISQSVVNMVN